jgi:cholesterol transport system auxiliary component
MIRLARAAIVVACAAALSACVSLLPRTEPARLYRFDGGTATSTPSAAPAGATFAVMKTRGSFDPAASGDRILTVSGQEVAYIAEARWAAPAVVLFDQALTRAFDTNSGPARLIARTRTSHAQYVLQVDVRDFAALYENGPEAAPGILVRGRATLMRASDRTVVSEQMFEAKIPAGENRVSAIAVAFERAVSEAIGKIVDLTNAGVTAPAPSPR